MKHVGVLSKILCVLLATAAFAQQDRGTITGTVTDQSGATVPGVKVTITQVQTNLKNETVTKAK